MISDKLIEQVVLDVLEGLQKNEGTGAAAPPLAEAQPAVATCPAAPEASQADADIVDITAKQERETPRIDEPLDREALRRMMQTTVARIGVGKAGPRLKTKTMLTLRADHATAQDAVFADVSQDTLDEMKLKSLQTMCEDRNQHLTRPDLGRQFSGDTLQEMKRICVQGAQVQIYVSDGLSSSAIEANVRDILPVLMKGLEQYGIRVGTPFFVKYGRVPAMDVVSDTLGCELTCVLIGERPGLAAAESMSAYIVYKASVGIPESKRTVVSNIYPGGTPAVEAGAYIADVIKKMLELRTSGVDLKL